MSTGKKPLVEKEYWCWNVKVDEIVKAKTEAKK